MSRYEQAQMRINAARSAYRTGVRFVDACEMPMDARQQAFAWSLGTEIDARFDAACAACEVSK